MFPTTINITMDTKKCKLCNVEKGLNDFYKCGGRYASRCKKCFNEYQKNNPNKKNNNKRYVDKNREIINLKTRKKYHENLEETRKKEREKQKRLRKLNPEKYRKYSNMKSKERYHKKKNDPKYRIERILRGRLLRAVTLKHKKSSCIKLLGCSVDELKIYLESKFKEGMTWENHGVKGWHIDHIIPCASFDLTKEEEQKKCFHYSNLQPLWWIDNLRKSNKVEGEPPPST
jgi:hypothetical protein